MLVLNLNGMHVTYTCTHMLRTSQMTVIIKRKVYGVQDHYTEGPIAYSTFNDLF